MAKDTLLVLFCTGWFHKAVIGGVMSVMSYLIASLLPFMLFAFVLGFTVGWFGMERL